MRCAVCYADCVVLLVLLVLPENHLFLCDVGPRQSRSNPCFNVPCLVQGTTYHIKYLVHAQWTLVLPKHGICTTVDIDQYHINVLSNLFLLFISSVPAN
ncbi:Uncharacterized protein HZ326_15343 [Fusarium oxysporum f. sp. albedinis]|nr:Uncharacterized protein HZ326_15343 [Fusarium oxysporum f. sp. albedinis]